MKKTVTLLLVLVLAFLCACSPNSVQNLPTNPPISNSNNWQNNVTPTPNGNSQDSITATPTEAPAPSPSPTQLPNIEKTYLARVNVSNVLNMRFQPDSNSKVVATLPKGAIVQVLYAKDGWCCVNKDKALDGNEYVAVGFCKQDYLEPITDIDAVYAPLNPVKYTLTDKGYSVKVFRFGVKCNDGENNYLSPEKINYYTDMYLYNEKGEFVSTVVSPNSSYFFYKENPPQYDSWNEVYLHFLIEDFADNGSPYLFFQKLSDENYIRYVSEQEIKQMQQEESYERDYPSVIGENKAELHVCTDMFGVCDKYFEVDDVELDLSLPIGNPFHPLYKDNLDYILDYYRSKLKR